MEEKYTDTELLDYLETLTEARTYTGKCILRLSTTGRGWRLHESSHPEAKPSVREAIIAFIEAQEPTP